MIRIDLRNQANRQRLTATWLLLQLTWSAIRSYVIAEVFGSHGTDANRYFLIDALSTIPYSIYSAKAVFAALDRSNKFLIYVGISGLAFLVPDIYVFATARQVARTIWIEFILYIIVMICLAVYKARADHQKIKSGL